MKIAGIVLAVVLLFSTVALVFGHRSETPLLFDREVWKREADNERLRMVSDLTPKLMGISKAQVEHLLGEPVTDVGLYPGDYFYYVLGTQKKFGDTDGIWLCLKFKNNRVDAVQIAHD